MQSKKGHDLRLGNVTISHSHLQHKHHEGKLEPLHEKDDNYTQRVKLLNALRRLTTLPLVRIANLNILKNLGALTNYDVYIPDYARFVRVVANSPLYISFDSPIQSPVNPGDETTGSLLVSGNYYFCDTVKALTIMSPTAQVVSIAFYKDV